MNHIYFGGDTSYKAAILQAMGADKFVETGTIYEHNDIVYWVYGGGPDPRKNLKLWIRRRPIVILHWIGTDTLIWSNALLTGGFLRRTWYKFRRYLINRKVRRNELINLVCADWLGTELQQIGIANAMTIPISSIHESLIASTSKGTEKNIDFVSYVPSHRFDFYGGPMILDLAKQMPNRRFHIVHPDLDQISDAVIKSYPPNLSVSPKVPFNKMQELLAASKCFLRFTKHDGLSLSVLEAMLHRSTVFWTQPFPYTHHVDFGTEAPEVIRLRLDEAIETWTENENGRQYVIEHFTTENLSVLYKSMFLRLHKA